MNKKMNSIEVTAKMADATPEELEDLVRKNG